LNEPLEGGTHQVEWTKQKGILKKGIYLSILNVDGEKEIEKIMVE
jgi:hypothetical protein